LQCVAAHCATPITLREFILNGSIFFFLAVAFHENYTVAKLFLPGVMECPYYFRSFIFFRAVRAFIMSVVITYVFLPQTGIRVKFSFRDYAARVHRVFIALIFQ
jgi:hypothetical protein